MTMTSPESETFMLPEASDTHWGLLPDVSAKNIKYAVAKLQMIRGVLAGAKGEILCLHIDVRSRRRPHNCTVWRGSSASGYVVEKANGHITGSLINELCSAFAPLAREIASRWPERVRPEIIGIATDGHRIVFSPEYPQCHGNEWLILHQKGKAPASIISDDGVNGFFSKISSNKDKN